MARACRLLHRAQLQVVFLQMPARTLVSRLGARLRTPIRQRTLLDLEQQHRHQRIPQRLHRGPDSSRLPLQHFKNLHHLLRTGHLHRHPTPEHPQHLRYPLP